MLKDPPHVLLLALLAMIGVGAAGCVSYPTPLHRAHSHNDYEQPGPLRDAMKLGFASVEADIYLVEGELLIGHDREDLTPARTLEGLYLAPLRKYIERRDGRVFQDGSPMWLQIDIKSEAEPTYRALHELLAKYADIIASYGPGGRTDRPVRVVISGNRPREYMRSQKLRYAGYDGRMTDLQSQVAADFMPVISDNWRNHFEWRGEGEMPAAERAKLDRIVEHCHAYGRRVRFWGTPDDERFWQVAYEAGVDFLQTDDLKRLHRFLISRQTP